MGLLVSNYKNLRGLVGRVVRITRPFYHIPEGTVGKIVSHYVNGTHQGVMVEWQTSDGYTVQDGFGRDDSFDETQYLELV